MRSILSALSIGGSLITILNALTAPVVAKGDKPTIKLSTFDYPLENVFYFDDSNTILGLDRDSSSIFRSDDAGETWAKINDDGQAGDSYDVWPHPWDNQRAYILGEGKKNWMTKNQGKSWKSFTLGSSLAFSIGDPLKFHGRDAKKVIWNGETCVDFIFCDQVAYYTDDDFETTHSLGEGTKGCHWAVGTPMFGEEIADEIDDRIFCIKQGLYSGRSKHNRLMVSDDYFKHEEIEPPLENGRAVAGIINMAAVKKYIVAAAKSEGTNELALYVTDDGSQWHRAEFGQHRIEEDAYTILESTNYSMQVDVLGSRPSKPVGYLFTSNSNGTYFTRNIDHTNRNFNGRVDFEKVQNIQGIVLVNIVDNWRDIEKSALADKKVVSKISFDDGRSFADLKVGGDILHLHSVTDATQGGRVFSSPAPGIVMGVGNTGSFLKSYEDGDLFVSDDAGRTWRKALDGAHMYEFGNNGAILVAVDDEQPTNHIRYSLNHGKDWSKAELEEKIRVKFITTVPDSTTRKFLMMGTSGAGSKTKWQIFKIDFDGLHERNCDKKDFEEWTARVDDDGKPSCVMGAEQYFTRRKADAECFVDADFKDPEPKWVECTCAQEDFECDYDFVRDPSDRKKCNPVAALKVPEGKCKNEDDTFKGPSGWRLIPGNRCNRKGGLELDKEIDRPCTDTIKKPASGKIEVEKTDFQADLFQEWFYLQRTESGQGDDETLVMLNSERQLFMSRDHGKSWRQILKGETIVGIIPNPHYYDAVFFLTGSKTVHYTIDRGDSFHKFEAPQVPTTLRTPILKFHEDYRDWLIWAGAEGTSDHTTFHYSKDRGDHWQTLARSARKCDYIRRAKGDKLIYCEQYENEDWGKNLQLRSSDNFFADSETHFNNIIDYATMAEFIVVAAKKENQNSLSVDASVDGRIFAPAHFPKNFQPNNTQAYTVLDSSTHAVFLHVTVNSRPSQEYGTLVKSNSNGTSYVLTLSAVNRDYDGWVDFEKMQGLQGVAMVNVVSNVEEVDNGEKKKLKSQITHNDGAEWALIPPPKKDAVGNNYDCVGTENVATEKCSLHLHSYTERRDKSATFSSSSAVGLMMAVGNVGEFLDRKDGQSTDTFITRDAGITWKSVKKGSYMWEYGDQGSIIVIVPEAVATRSVFYTLDEGETWREYEFSTVDMIISAITTVPLDSSFNFLLWGKESGARGVISTVNLDFSQLSQRQRKCHLDENNPSNEDYELWEPRHPMQSDNCLFGHIAQYHRKRIEAECYNGMMIEHLHNIANNCSCSRRDYECDYNFQLQNDGSCQLVEGLKPLSHELFCKENPEQREFYEVTGYRKIPMSTCEGGRELEKGESFPCPGYEEEFDRKHGLGGVAIFFIVVLSLGAACGVGYWVWQRYQMYGFGGFGQIRLGEGVSSGGSGSSIQGALIAVPVAIVAGTWAVAKAIPLLASSLFRSAKGYVPVASRTGYSSGPYRSRDAFSRRQDYTTAAYVEDDELLGDEDELDGEDV